MLGGFFRVSEVWEPWALDKARAAAGRDEAWSQAITHRTATYLSGVLGWRSGSTEGKTVQPGGAVIVNPDYRHFSQNIP